MTHKNTLCIGNEILELLELYGSITFGMTNDGLSVYPCKTAVVLFNIGIDCHIYLSSDELFSAEVGSSLFRRL